MGNTSSENPVCECTSSTSVHKLYSGSLRTRGGPTGSETMSDNILFEQTRNNGIVSNACDAGSHSLLESTMEVEAVAVKKTETTIHSYNLRPRISSKTKVPSSPHAPPSENGKQYLKDAQLLSISVDKLSLDITKETNMIADEVMGSSSSSSKKISSDEKVQERVLYYGWFCSAETSSVIHQAVLQIFRQCYAQVPQFESFITKCSKDAGVQDPLEYYRRSGKRERTKVADVQEYHITAKFLGRDPDPYYEALVHPFLEKSFYIRLVGIIFTARTLGVRVKLTPAQQLIFEEKYDSTTVECQPTLNEQSNESSHIQYQIHKELVSYNQQHKKHKKGYPNCKLKTDAVKDNNIIFRRVGAPLALRTTTSRAHITIGCAPKVLPKQTGCDLVDLIDLEQTPCSTSSSSSNFQQDFKLEGGVLRQFGTQSDNVFVFYSDIDMIVPARFNFFI